MSAGQREGDGEGDDETGEYAELPENWLKVAALAQDAFCLRSDDEHAPHNKALIQMCHPRSYSK